MSGRLIRHSLLLIPLCLATGADADADSVTLRFAWPEVRNLPVDSYYSHDFLNAAHSHSGRITTQRLLDIEPVDDGLRVTQQVLDVGHDMQPEAGDIGSDVVDIIVTLGQELPAMRLTEQGQLLGFTDFPAFRGRLLDRLDEFLDDLDHQRAMPDIIEYFDEHQRLEHFVRPAIEKALSTSLEQARLQRSLSETLYVQNAIWHERSLQIDRPQTEYREQRWPVLNEIALPFREELRYLGRVDCQPDSQLDDCVHLHYQAQPEPAALDDYLRSPAANRVTIGDVTLHGRIASVSQNISLSLIAEPDGLIPHQIIHEEESRAVLLTIDGRELPIRELKQARHHYHWPKAGQPEPLPEQDTPE